MTMKLLREYLELEVYCDGLFDQTHQRLQDFLSAVRFRSCDV
jgi:hypothetical protein